MFSIKRINYSKMLFNRGKVVKEQHASHPNEAGAPPPALWILISFTKVWKMLIYSLLLVFFDVHIAYFQTLILLFFRICSCKLVWELRAWFSTSVISPVSFLIHTFVYKISCMESHKEGSTCSARHATNQKHIRATVHYLQ